jgi:DNA-binding NarL/FixJ family response regulator
MTLVGEAATGREGIQMYREHRPDVIILDLRLPDQNGIDVINCIREIYSDARIIMLTTFDGDIDIQRALAAGARAYILKSMPPSDLVAVIRQVHAGMKRVLPEIAAHLAEHLDDEDLTAREIEILQHIVGGNRNRDIADMLFISEETVKAHVKNIMAKLGANDRTEAVAIGIRRGFIQLGG